LLTTEARQWRREDNEVNFRKLFNLLFAALFVLSLLPGVALAQPQPAAQPAATIESDVLTALAEGPAGFFVDMADRADLSQAYDIEDWDARGWYVYNALKAVADRSQLPVIEYAKDNDLAYRSFFGSNTVYIEGGMLQDALMLASLPGVARLHMGEDMYIEPQDAPAGEPDDSTDAYGWNLDTLDPASSLYGMQAAQV